FQFFEGEKRMLSVEDNEKLTKVGPGTPMGDLLRRYWQPVAAVADVEREKVLPLRRLGEDLVLYQDRSGTLGLLQDRCPHRNASLAYGIPSENGLRCAYHGWMFNEAGRCLAQPFEETANAAANFK